MFFSKLLEDNLISKNELLLFDTVEGLHVEFCIEIFLNSPFS
jgi:hypothetical protein